MYSLQVEPYPVLCLTLLFLECIVCMLRTHSYSLIISLRLLLYIVPRFLSHFLLGLFSIQSPLLGKQFATVMNSTSFNTQCSQPSRAPTGPGGRTVKSPGRDGTTKYVPSPSGKSKDDRYKQRRQDGQSEKIFVLGS